MAKIADTNDLALVGVKDDRQVEMVHPLEIACALAAIDGFMKENLYPIRKGNSVLALLIFSDVLLRKGGLGDQLLSSLPAEHRSLMATSTLTALSALNDALDDDDWTAWEQLCNSITNITYLDKLT
ncbi:MAG: hypothetical protein EBZ69_02135 [Alphaproteobacteria bacterium]|nr:hypothetical protein [Alphaproteobacteria bacterium]